MKSTKNPTEQAIAKATKLRVKASQAYNSAKSDVERDMAFKKVQKAARSLRVAERAEANGVVLAQASLQKQTRDPSSKGAADRNKINKIARQGGQTEVKSEKVKGYLKSLSSPWSGRGVLCPFSHNNEPSTRVVPATTTLFMEPIVPGGTCHQLSVFGGHSATANVNSMDPSSFHCTPVGRNGTADIIVPGPIQVTGQTANGCVWLTTGLSNEFATEDIGASNNTLQQWDQALPYVGTTAIGHSRWQLVSMGVRIHNITAIQTRAGNVVTVQKNNSNYIGSGNFPQDLFAIYPSWRDWGTNDVEIVRNFRSEDIAMWHVPSTAMNVGQTIYDYASATLKIWLNNSSGSAQTYALSFVFNWQLAGDLFGTVATPLITQPSTLMDSVTSIVQNFLPSSQKASEVYQHILSKGFDGVLEFIDRYASGEVPHHYAMLH
jgi:hypothetical protein